jgi:hypothetical protein
LAADSAASRRNWISAVEGAIVQAHEAGEMSGYLVKKGGASGSGMHNWKKRWVSLREGQWAYCQTHKMVDNPKDRLSLKGCLVKTREDKGKGHHENCFEIVFPDSKVTGERKRGMVRVVPCCYVLHILE